MILPKEHVSEKERLKELDSYSILDTLPESDYDDLTAIAAQICGTAVSLISLIDHKRQWFKSHHGLDATETPRDLAFCGHAIHDEHNVFVVEDAREDARFHDNPLVTGDTQVVFYAGVPLLSENGLPLGTLCVIDHKSKVLSNSQIASLRALGNQVMNILELRRAKLSLENASIKLEEKNRELERFAYVAAHDIKSPLIGISGLSEILSEKYGELLDKEGHQILGLLKNSTNKLTNLIDGLLAHSRSVKSLKEDISRIVLTDFIHELIGLFTYEQELKISLNALINTVDVNKAALEQIFINLVVNAIKYNDKKTIEIEIGVSASATHYQFYVQDNGPGIDSKNQESIFELFKVCAAQDRFGEQGNGIGLATVKKVVENCGGSISLESTPGMGAKFLFTLEK